MPIKHVLKLSIIAFALCAVVIVVHFWPGNNSMLNLNSWDNMNPSKGLNNDYLVEVVEYHKEEPSFQLRPITTYLTERIAWRTGLSIGTTFTALNFFLLWIAGILVSLLAFQVTGCLKNSYLSQIAFWFSFPILFAFFPTIYSYDDPFQYVFILTSLIFLHRQNLFFFTLAFSVSLIVRENGLILLPAIFWLFGDFEKKKFNKKNRNLLIAMVIPIIIYFGFSFLYANHLGIAADVREINQNRLVCFGQNFGIQQSFIESIFSFLLVCILPLSTWSEFKRWNKKWAWAFLFSLVINTIAVFLFAKARESRLFILPLFFWFPFAGNLLRKNLKIFLTNWKISKWRTVIIVTLTMVLSWLLAFYVYKPTAMQPYENWHQEYLFVLLTFVSILLYNQKALKT